MTTLRTPLMAIESPNRPCRTSAPYLEFYIASEGPLRGEACGARLGSVHRIQRFGSLAGLGHNSNVGNFFDISKARAWDAFFISSNHSHPSFSPYSETMKSLKRGRAADANASSISSKVYIRSTKSGKVQKIVREQYLRKDIPCSSQLCTSCASTTAVNANGVGK